MENATRVVFKSHSEVLFISRPSLVISTVRGGQTVNEFYTPPDIVFRNFTFVAESEAEIKFLREYKPNVGGVLYIEVPSAPSAPVKPVVDSLTQKTEETQPGNLPDLLPDSSPESSTSSVSSVEELAVVKTKNAGIAYLVTKKQAKPEDFAEVKTIAAFVEVAKTKFGVEFPNLKAS